MDRKYLITLSVFLCLTALLCLFSPEPAHAALDSTIIGTDGTVCPGSGYTARVVNCIQSALNNATDTYFNSVYSFFRPVIMAVILLGVVIFGVLVATGGLEAPPRDTFVLLIKIGAILYFTENFQSFFGEIMAGVRSLLEIVTSYISTTSTTDCAVGVTNIWARVDCSINKIIGITPGVLAAGGILGFLVACTLSKYTGVAIFILGVGLILTLLFSIARAVQIFIMSYIGLTFMVMISPMIIPLILFRVTKGMFEKWLKISISFLLQPVFLFAYLAMMLVAFDAAVYGGPKSLFGSIAGDQVTSPSFSLNKYLVDNGLYTKELKFDWVLDLVPEDQPKPDKVEETGWFGAVGSFVSAPIESLKQTGKYVGQTAMKKLAAGLSSISVGIPFQVVDFKKMSTLRGYSNAGDMLKSILMAMMNCFLVVYILNIMLKYIPDLAREVTGGVYETLNVSEVSALPGEGYAAQGMQKMSSSLGGYKGGR